VRLKLAAHAKGKLAITVPKATLTVKPQVDGVPQRHTVSTKLRTQQLKTEAKLGSTW